MYKSLNKKKILSIITGLPMGGASTKTISTLSIVNPSVIVLFLSSTALLISTATLNTNEYISKLGIRYVKLRDFLI